MLRGLGLPSKSVMALWLMVLAILPVIAVADTWGWDLIPLRNALHSLDAGVDVYERDIAAQEQFHNQTASGQGTEPPVMYVYPPLTLPLLNALGAVKIPYKAALFLVLCVAGSLLQTWAVSHAMEPMELRAFAYAVPFTLFFSGLLASSNILSGNVAYILYGIMLAAAVRGWQSEKWGAFYVAVLFASMFKPPYLTLLAVPVLSSRRQWTRAGLTAVTGLALFLSQSLVWPVQFARYTRTLAVMFEWQHDFGSSPAGIFATALLSSGRASSHTFLGFYLLYAIPLFVLLLYLSRRYFAGEFSLQQWIPTLLVGVILLNPRIIEYDVAPLTLPLALIAWRALRGIRPVLQAVVGGIGFVAVNAFALRSWNNWKLAEGFVLIVFFAVGTIDLWQYDQGAQTRRA